MPPHTPTELLLDPAALAGRLIVLEGGEGVGKTTQIQALATWLTRQGVVVSAMREPGGTAAGDRIRSLLLDPDVDLTATTETLLFLASRAQHVVERVRPALLAGRTVLLDRFLLSTYAYQIGGRGVDSAAVRVANGLAVDGLVPDLTLLLTLDEREGLARAAARSAVDRMEAAGAAFHARVSDAFRTFAEPAWQEGHPETGPIQAVDAQGSIEAVTARLKDAIITWATTGRQAR